MKPFIPSRGLANRHIQTLLGPFIVGVHYHPKRWQIVELSDGDFLELAWFGEPDKPVVLFFHGLEGSYESHYIQRIIHHLHGKEFTPVVAHFRSCGRKQNRRTSSYHSGITSDLSEILEAETLQDHSEIYAAGFSLGGNVLLKWLGENPNQQKIKKAIAVSVPLKLDICADAINTGFAKLYQYHLIKLLKIKVLEKSKIDLKGPELASYDTVKKITNFWQFDDLVTAPLHGFDGVNDYYKRASSFPLLKNIQTPTLLLQAYDDPFLHPSMMPSRDDLSDKINLVATKHGGHLGFWEQRHWLKQCYLADLVDQLIGS